MRVRIGALEWTFYITERGAWVMHAWDNSKPEGEQWVDTWRDASFADPYKHEPSTVEYDAWA